MPYVPGENRKAVDIGRRRDGKVGKARRLTRCARLVYQRPGETSPSGDGVFTERTFVSTRYKAEPKVRRHVPASYRAA